MSETVRESVATENVVVFGPGRGLVGIVTSPSEDGNARAARGTGVILFNAGVVHRVGPNRLYVTLARRLAACGFTVLRFDHSGIGDSTRHLDDLSFEHSSVAEAADAMNWLAAERGCDKFVLMGLCSGTLTAFKAAQADRRVVALVLLTALLQDPSTVPAEVVAEATNRRVARSYLVEKAGDGGTWRRVLTGKVNYGNAWRTLRRLASARFRSRPIDTGTAEIVTQLERLLAAGVSVLFLFAEPTTVLEYFRMTLEPQIPALRKLGRIDTTILTHADHTFTQLRHQRRVVEIIPGWLSECLAAGSPGQAT
jgi:pimeloyl-ACP methyl ester carboxylesterase